MVLAPQSNATALQPQAKTEPGLGPAQQSLPLQAPGSHQANVSPPLTLFVEGHLLLLSGVLPLQQCPVALGRIRHTTADHPGRPGKPPAPRSSRRNPSPILHSLSSTSGAQTAGTSALPKSPGPPEGRPGPLTETARRRRPGPPGTPPPPPALRCATRAARAVVRSDRLGPCPPGRRDPPTNPPAPPLMSSRERRTTGRCNVRCACALSGQTTRPGPLPRSGKAISQPPKRTAAGANAAPGVSGACTPVRLRPHRPSEGINGETARGPAEPHTVTAILPTGQATPPAVKRFKCYK
ncbi:hypothetical protein NDU88_003371 [Pleurodeles waltl]|uniref:Basic proline-rich protein-like n=1 Tax=Pleurodeles waltl TaxID=8319 RepID=A0AAV7KUN9_PLEWA|nr:hypothetical protein NDU88_003371 [Pleurodeles waltl]